MKTKWLLTCFGVVYLVQGGIFVLLPELPAKEALLDLQGPNVGVVHALFQVVGIGTIALALLALMLRDVSGPMESSVLLSYLVIGVLFLSISTYHQFVVDITVPIAAFVLMTIFLILFIITYIRHNSN